MAFAVVGILRIAAILPEQSRRDDFVHYYLSAKVLAMGASPYGVSFDQECKNHGIVFNPDVPVATNPPLLIWMWTPLATLPAKTAFGIWVVIQVAALGAILWMIFRSVGNRLSGRAWFFVVTLTVGSMPLYLHFAFSQVQLLLVAMVLLAYRLHGRGSENAACALATAAAVLKVYPSVLLPWFVWRGTAGMTGKVRRLGVVVTVAGVLVVLSGPGLWRDFYRVGRPVVEQWARVHFFNFSVPGLLAQGAYRMRGVDADSDAGRRIWRWCVGAGWVMVAAGWVRMLWQRETDREAEFCLMVMGMLAGGGLAWGHYYIWALFPVVVAAARAAGTVWLAAVVVGLNLVRSSHGEWGNRYGWVDWFALLVPVGSLVVLWWYFGREVGRWSQERN